jgi:hypothetical protein
MRSLVIRTSSHVELHPATDYLCTLSKNVDKVIPSLNYVHYHMWTEMSGQHPTTPLTSLISGGISIRRKL